MPKHDDRKGLNETASRANDQKDSRTQDREGEGVPQGGKRRGPGRWVDPKATDD